MKTKRLRPTSVRPFDCMSEVRSIHKATLAAALGWATFARVGGLLLALLLVAVLMPAAARAGGDVALGPASGLPVPRFVTLKPDRVNVRTGPTKDHEVTWVYTRAGLPVEITAESENWRRIRDWEGAEGWVYHSMLSGRRAALVTAKSKGDLVPLYDKADTQADIVAKLQPGVLGTVKQCSGTWCHLVGTGFDGWIVQDRLWGVYPNEKLD